MENKPGKPINIVLIVAMTVAIGLLVVLHADPVQTLIGMLVGVFVLVVLVDGGKQRVLSKKLGAGIQQEIDAGRSYAADVPAQVLSLLKDGKKIQAIKALRESSGLSLLDAKNKLDEIHLRLSMGQAIDSRSE